LTENLIEEFFKEPNHRKLLLEARENSIKHDTGIVFLRACAEHPPYNHQVNEKGDILDSNGRMLSETNPEEYKIIISNAKKQARQESHLFKDVLG